MSEDRSRGEASHYTDARKIGTYSSEHSQNRVGGGSSGLLRLYLLVHRRLLLGLLLRVLFGKMPADETTAHGPHHRMMSRVMAGDPADHRALDATRRVGGSDRGERQRGAEEGKPDATCVHVSITRVWMGAAGVSAKIDT
jgi:hypothetical protein